MQKINYSDGRIEFELDCLTCTKNSNNNPCTCRIYSGDSKLPNLYQQIRK